MKKVCVLSYFGLGDCIRFSPIFKGLEEMVGSCHFDFTSPVSPLKNLFSASQIQILPMTFSKHYDIVLNFVSSMKPERDIDKSIWRGFIGTGSSFIATHDDPGQLYKEFVCKFEKINRNSDELVTLCKYYSPLLPEPTVVRFCRFMGIKPSSYEYLYKVSNEERVLAQEFISKDKKNICIAPRATAKVRCLDTPMVEKIFDLVKGENVILLGTKDQCSDLLHLPCKTAFGDLRLSGAVIEQADCVIAIDSYFSHVSFAVGTPSVVLYSYGPNFTKALVEKAPIVALEHPTEGCNSIPILDVEKALRSIL
jgi:ADP-heptose:LPS heptosyltransferase